MQQSATDILKERYPGIELESPVQASVYLEKYEEGLRCYQQLPTPNAKDERWLGVCHFQLFDDLKAIETFLRAIAKGEETARINLAHSYFYVERGKDVLPELQKLEFDNLAPYDQVLYLRVRSYHHETSGQLRAALDDAEQAWARVQGIPELPVLAPQILNQLGILYARIGRAKRALWFLERSLELSEGLEHKKALLRRAYLYCMLGRYEDAYQDIQHVQQDVIPEQLKADILLRLGDMAWSKKDIPTAIRHYENAISTALKTQAFYEEFLARLSLVVLEGKRKLFETAAEHLARAHNLVSDQTDALLFRFREILIHHWVGRYSNEHSLSELHMLNDKLYTMGLMQEQAWVRLHIAELLRLENDPAYKLELDKLQALAVSLQNDALLAKEWALLPELHELALSSHPRIAGKTAHRLEVYTMGEEKLILDGKVVHIPLRKAVEVIAYFLEHGRVSLKKLLLDIFADEDPKTARNYFHQFRHELHERIPGLRVIYNPAERSYHLRQEIQLLWDVAEFRQGRNMGTSGIFLLSSGSEWAEQLEHRLQMLRDKREAQLQR